MIFRLKQKRTHPLTVGIPIALGNSPRPLIISCWWSVFHPIHEKLHAPQPNVPENNVLSFQDPTPMLVLTMHRTQQSVGRVGNRPPSKEKTIFFLHLLCPRQIVIAAEPFGRDPTKPPTRGSQYRPTDPAPPSKPNQLAFQTSDGTRRPYFLHHDATQVNRCRNRQAQTHYGPPLNVNADHAGIYMGNTYPRANWSNTDQS